MNLTNKINMHFDLQKFALGATEVPLELVQKYWAKKLWKSIVDNSYFTKFTGEGSNFIIQRVEDLKKNAGDMVRIPLRLKLDGVPVMDDNILEGNEEAMEFRAFDVTIHQYRHAVKLKGKFEEQKTDIRLRSEAKDALTDYWTEFLDVHIFKKLADNPTPDRRVFPDMTITSDAAITAGPGHEFSTDIIGVAKRIAMLSEPKIRPIKVNGANRYVIVIDSYQARDLRKDEKWINAQESANIRGETNPIFSGALGIWEGVVVHEAENAGKLRTPTGDGGTMVGHAMLLGAQAGVLAVAKEMSWVEKSFDYANQYGVSFSIILEAAKSKFKNKAGVMSDFGVVNIATASVGDR